MPDPKRSPQKLSGLPRTPSLAHAPTGTDFLSGEAGASPVRPVPTSIAVYKAARRSCATEPMS